MSELEKQVETEAQPEAVDTKAEQPAEAEPAAAAEAAQDPEQPTETLKNEEAKSEDMQVAPSKERSPERSRDRSRDGDRRREREADKDFRARSRSRSRDRRRRSRSRSRDRRRSRSRSRSRDKRDGHRSRRSRFEEEDEEEREERRKRAAAAAAAAAPPGAFPGPPGSDAALAALRAANPALAALDPATAQLVLRQQMLLQQQLLLQQQAALQAQQVMSKAQKTQSSVQRMAEKQSKAMRELFVGNLAPGAVTEQSLYQVFHSALIAAFPQAAQPGHEPVLRVNITGRFAFVEFRLPEYATAALQLNGQIALMGNTLKIARPSSYVEPTAAISPMGIAGMGVPGAPGMTLPGPPGVGHMQGNMPGYGGLPGMPPAGPASGGVTDPLATIVPTPFLCVTGMVTADVLANDEEYREVIADLHQECSKHGVVAEVKVPRPPPGQVLQLMGTGHYGKAFVHFVDVPSAQKAKDAIHGRMFAGNIVQAFNVALPTFQSVPGN